MAFSFTVGTQYLVADSPITGANPFTVACWCNTNNDVTKTAIGLESSNASSFARLNYASETNGRTITMSFKDDASGVISLNSTAQYQLNTWHHSCFIDSITSRNIYLDAANSPAGNTLQRSYSFTKLIIGAANTTSPVNRWRGSLCEIGIWEDILTLAEIQALAKGMTCDKIRPQSLKFYAPLIRDLNDLKGGLPITNVNAVSQAPHPRIY